MDTFGIITLILQAIISAVLCNILAEKKGYDPGNWIAIGFFFGILGLIAAAGLPDRKLSNKDKVSLIKDCPDCLETIHSAASICRYCGKKFSNTDIVSNLVDILKNGNKDQQLKIIGIFRKTKEVSAIPEVLNMMGRETDGCEWPEPFQSAADFIVECYVERITPELITITKKCTSVRKKEILLNMLGEIKDEASIPTLIENLNNHEINYYAIKSLVMIGDKSILALEKFGEEGKRSDKRLAEKIISQIKEYQEKGRG